MNGRYALLALLAGGPLACIESPAAPTAGQPQTPASRPADPRFDDRFWRELIFNEHDAPGQGDFVRVLSNPSPSVYVRLGNAGGTRRVVADDRLDHIREVVPPLAEQITGRPYAGRIESGIEERGDREGWITAMMSETGNDTEWFTQRERYHAQLAYEVGRGAAYCGWPFGSVCAGGT